jgi:zeaxanthin glucosyltransferase
MCKLWLMSAKTKGAVKIGFVSMPLSGHLNPMTALARRVKSRGNEVVFFGVPDRRAALQ